MNTGRAPDFNQWLTRIHGFKVGASRNSYTVADLEAAWNAAERAWMEVANKNAQERNAAVDREVVLLEALRQTLPILIGAIAFVDCKAVVAEVRTAIQQAERTE